MSEKPIISVIIPEKWTPRSLVLYAIVPMVRIISGVSAGMIFAAREAFEAVGGFDERLYAADDLEFVRALKAYGDKTGKKFAKASDVSVTTSVRRLSHPRLKDWLVFPKYLFHPESVRKGENCSLWYADKTREE